MDDTGLTAMLLHQRAGHVSHQKLQEMASSGDYTHLPAKIPKLRHPCQVCLIAKGKRLPRQPTVSTTNVAPGTRFHLDFSFFNVTSCSEFSAALTIVDATTSNPFGYPTRSKRPPLALIRNFVTVARRNGYPCLIFCMDEGGELTCSADLVHLVVEELGIIVETTGGHASSINGKVERPHQTIKNMVRVQLISRGHSDELWCLCYQYTIWLIARILNRRVGTAPHRRLVQTQRHRLQD